MIEVGEYVRTKNGIIGSLIEISKAGNGTRYAGEYITDTIISIYTKPHTEVRVKDKEVKSHSKNIIDLIEVGDYVNGERVIKDNLENLVICPTIISNGLYNTAETYKNRLDKIEIESIVTKEQFANIEYRLED